MRKLAVFLSMLVLIFIAATFCAMYAEIMVTKEMLVKDGQLTDNDGRVVSTSAQVDTIKGVQLAQDRRLSNANSSEIFQISASMVFSTIESYTGGKINWVVPFPDGTVRTVFLQGTEGEMSSWGSCATRDGQYGWQVSCS